MNTSSPAPRAVTLAQTESKSVPKFSFPIPIDPVRLLGGILSRWSWILVGIAIFSVLGILFGIKITHQTFSISVALIKRAVPQTVQASQVGQAYRPEDLSDATLLETLLATEPLDKAMKRAKNGISPGRASSLVEASQAEGTNIYYITYHSPISPDDALNFSKIWAEEIESYTQQFQRTEAHGVRMILQKEVTELENQTNNINSEIRNFSKEKDYFGGESQVSAALSKQSLIELQLETARATSASKTEQLDNLIEQIQRQSPIEQQLKTANAELATLRATYTDSNPLVQTKLQSIEFLSTQISALNENKLEKINYEAYTGTPLGNQIFLNILSLQDQVYEAKCQAEALEKLAANNLKRISEFATIISSYEALKARRDAISEALSIMTNRLKEAEIFASGAPGYWQLFQAPDQRRIVASSLATKPIMFGALGAFFGGGLTSLLSLLLSHRSERRSALDCCIASKAPLIASISAVSEEERIEEMNHLWITYLAPMHRASTKILFWTASMKPEEEQIFWKALATAAATDRQEPLMLCDLTPNELWNNAAPTENQERVLNWSPELSECGIYRASSLPKLPIRNFLPEIPVWISVITTHKTATALTVEQRSLTSAYLPPCTGTLVWSTPPSDVIRKIADIASRFLAHHFSKIKLV